jgi:GAF domain-containing protein
VSGDELKRLLDDFISDEAVPEPPPIEAWALEEGRPEGLGARAIQLQAAAEVSSAASSLLDLDELLSLVVELIRERFNLYYIGIFLLEGAEAVLRAGSGRAGRRMIEQNHRLPVGDGSMIGWCVAHNQARIALDVGQDAVRFDNPFLPQTRSEMALPLNSRGRVLGAMTIQSSLPAAFGEADVAVLQIMADQLANAIENARLFAEREDALAEMEVLYHTSRRLTAAQTLQEVLAAVADGTRVPDINRVLLWEMERSAGAATERRVVALRVAANWHSGEAAAPLPVGTRLRLEAIPAAHLFLTSKEVLVEDVASDERLDGAMWEAVFGKDARAGAILPLSIGSQQIGVLVLIADRPHHFTSGEVRPYRSLSGQIAVVYENRRLLAETQRHAQEQMILSSVGQALAGCRDVRSVLDHLREGVERLLGGTGATNVAGFYVMLHDASREETWLALQVIDSQVQRPWVPVPKTSGLVSYLMRTRRPLRLLDRPVEQVKQMGITPMPSLAKGTTASCLGVPILLGDEVLGAMVALDSQQGGAYDARSEELMLALADRAALALQNVRLLAETREALEEVEAAHRSYLRRDWQEYLQQQSLLEASAVVYDERLAGAGQREQAVALPGFWRPEMESALQGAAGIAANGSEASETEERVQEAGRGLAVPITLRGQTLGVLGVEAPPDGREWTQEDRSLVEAISEQLAQTLEVARLFAETQRRAERERLVGEITAKIRASTDISDILEATAVELGRVLGTSRARVRLNVVDELDDGVALLRAGTPGRDAGGGVEDGA